MLEQFPDVNLGNTSVDGDSNRSEDPNAVPMENEEGVTTENNGGDISAMDLTQSFLADNHPAKSLPPIDLLLLIDSSSSIGISNFEQMKTCINAVLENVDISPGRSRVAAVTFASEPTVSFHFDKYYTQESVKGPDCSESSRLFGLRTVDSGQRILDSFELGLFSELDSILLTF
uniref:VWFA domain-containing protein n=1 Tax=Ascaris lumbricoides TaxID=6252 RepID=A0A9J2P8F5_ASCLU